MKKQISQYEFARLQALGKHCHRLLELLKSFEDEFFAEIEVEQNVANLEAVDCVTEVI